MRRGDIFTHEGDVSHASGGKEYKLYSLVRCLMYESYERKLKNKNSGDLGTQLSANFNRETKLCKATAGNYPVSHPRLLRLSTSAFTYVPLPH